MKKYTFLFFLLLSVIQSMAQSISGSWANETAKIADKIVLDTCVLQCIYHYQIIDNDIQNMREFDVITEIGDSVCKYECYQNFRIDSTLAVIGNVTNKELFELNAKYSPNFREFLIENLNTHSLDYYGNVSIDNYTYQEEIPAINWELEDDTKEICGYLCHKATCDFRGRKWIAWYCDIPKSVGPWKLNGLPGLILAAETEDKEHTFSAISVRKSSSPIIVRDTEYFKTTREHFNKALADYKSNPAKSWKNSPLAPKDMNGKTMPIPKRKLFYNPLEKE